MAVVDGSAQAQSHGVKRNSRGAHKMSKAKKQKLAAPSQITGSHDEVLNADIAAIMRQQKLAGNVDAQEQSGHEESNQTPSLPETFTEVEVNITTISSTGDGLGHVPGSLRIYLVPFTVPGDTVIAKVIRHTEDPPHTMTDFVRVVTPAPDRDDKLIGCRYFGKCSGCQLQILPYELQLAHKRSVLQKAYQNFSGLPNNAIPDIGETLPSPLKYGYRTKLTPHFDGPRGGRTAMRRGETPKFEDVPPIGFMLKGTRKTLDIEECPIGTEAVQRGLVRERRRVKEELGKYKRGATILLRESTHWVKKTPEQAKNTLESAVDDETVYEDRGDVIHAKTCISDHRGTSTEFVDDFMFQNPANAFFQNNNSILPSFTAYIREHVLPSPSSSSSPTTPITNLIDAYSGSGLFAITLSSLFTRIIGIDISVESIECATTNLCLNDLDNSKNNSKRDIKFLTADASELFASVPKDFHAANTAVVIDPPRKGCDKAFLKQLLTFGPARIVYVSCNVHTQARDVGWILRGGGATISDNNAEDNEHPDAVAAPKGPYTYEIESLRGFDFFPQTGHVEGVAVLKRRDGR